MTLQDWEHSASLLNRREEEEAMMQETEGSTGKDLSHRYDNVAFG